MNANLLRDLSAYDGRSIVLNIVSFLLPPLGLVLYLALMIARLPQKAVSAGRSATFGLGFYIIGVSIFGVIAYFEGRGYETPNSTVTLKPLPDFSKPPKSWIKYSISHHARAKRASSLHFL